MSTYETLCSQLLSSGDGFLWSAAQVPSERLFKTPPTGLGEWSAARHVFHLLFYEQNFSLPSVLQWLGEADPNFDGLDEEAAWGNKQDVANLLERFRQARTKQVDLLTGMDETLWQKTLTTGWGDVSLEWVMGKTYQHTAEHISDLLRIALFWDRFEARQRASPSKP